MKPVTRKPDPRPPTPEIQVHAHVEWIIENGFSVGGHSTLLLEEKVEADRAIKRRAAMAEVKAAAAALVGGAGGVTRGGENGTWHFEGGAGGVPEEVRSGLGLRSRVDGG